MFAIAFDLTVKEVTKHHPKSAATAYADIGATLAGFGFRWVQGSIYVCENEDMANLMDAFFGAICGTQGRLLRSNSSGYSP